MALSYLIGLPVLVTFYNTFLANESGGFGFGYVTALFTISSHSNSLLNLLLVAVGSTCLALVVGSWLAWVIARTDTPWRRILEVLIIFPIFLSTLAVAIAWFFLGSPRAGLINLILRTFLNSDGFVNVVSPAGVISVMGLSYAPYVFLFTVGAFKSIDTSLEEASTILGGSWFQTLRRVAMPLILPSLMASAIVVFLTATAEFAIPAILGYPAGFVPASVAIYEDTSATYPPRYDEAFALSAVLLLVGLVLLLLYRKVVGVSSSRFATIVGRGYRTNLVKLGRWKWLAWLTGVIYVLLSVVLPFSALVYASFTNYLSPQFTPGNFNLWGNFSTAFQIVYALPAIINTLILAGVGSSITIMLGFLSSHTIVKTDYSGRKAIDYFTVLPIAVPGIVLGLGIFWTYLIFPIPSWIRASLLMLLIAGIAHNIPFAVRSLSASLLQVSKELEESSTLLGAAPFQTFRRVLIPTVKTPILASWTLLIIFFMRELSTIIFLVTPNTTVLSVLIWDTLQEYTGNVGAALSLIQTVMMLVTVLVLRRVLRVSLSMGAYDAYRG